MYHRLWKGFGAIGHARELRQRLIKRASIFGDPITENAPQAQPNKGKIFWGDEGTHNLVVKLNQNGEMPERILVNDRTYDIVETENDPEPSPEEKRLQVIDRKFSKLADGLIDRFGMKIALKVAEWNSKLDILTSSIALGLELAASALVVVGAVIAIAKNNVSEIIEKLRGEVDSAQLILEVGVGVTVGFTFFAWLKQFLDDTQRVLVNQVKLRLHKEGSEKYNAFLELEEKYLKKEIEGPEGNLFYILVQDLPMIGKFVGHIMEEYYNIKFEIRELKALREMKAFISNMESQSNGDRNDSKTLSN